MVVPVRVMAAAVAEQDNVVLVPRQAAQALKASSLSLGRTKGSFDVLKAIFAAIVVLLAFPSIPYAQDQFVSYTIDKAEHDKILNYLADLPAKFANPLIVELTNLANAAAKAEKDKAKPAEKK